MNYQEALNVLKTVAKAQKLHAFSTPKERTHFLSPLKNLLLKNVEQLAALITQQMHKPIKESRAEIRKCALLCEYYEQVGPSLLEPQNFFAYPATSDQSYVRYDPIGTVLGIMPWNFPFWQVFRFAIPTLIAGNAVILKHAPNVLKVGDEIEELFKQSGLKKDLFNHLPIDVDTTHQLVATPYISAVTLTGSEKAGQSIAQTAGQNLKKVVLELGGSDPFLVFPDAPMEQTIQGACQGRLLNSGQSCIASKRFIIHQDIYDKFCEKLLESIKNYIIGDPKDEKTQIGPLARHDLRDQLQNQVQRSLKAGAKKLWSSQVPEDPELPYHPITVLTEIPKSSPPYKEEFFGPVFLIFKAKNEQEMIDLANSTTFGLGSTIWTLDPKRIQRVVPLIEAGQVFINTPCASNVALPFGGTKNSGMGRELSTFGMHEFVNIKTVYNHVV